MDSYVIRACVYLDPCTGKQRYEVYAAHFGAGGMHVRDVRLWATCPMVVGSSSDRRARAEWRAECARLGVPMEHEDYGSSDVDRETFLRVVEEARR